MEFFLVMRITYIHQYFNTPSMTGSTRSYEMGRRLVKYGHEVNIITSWREASQDLKAFKSVEDGINVYWIPVQYSNHMKFHHRILSFFAFAFGAFKMALSIKTDIIFASSTPLTIALPGVFASKWRKVPFVFEVRDLWPELPIAVGALKNPILKRAAQQLERFAYKHANAIVALSQGMKDGIVKTGYPSKKIVVIPNGSDLDKFDHRKPKKGQLRTHYSIPVESIVILYPGTFGYINGLAYLIRLAEKFLDDQRVFFLTVGNGIEFDQVKKLAEETGCLGHNVLMLDQVSKADVATIFETADIVISTVIPLPELEANSANKFFDGLAALKKQRNSCPDG